MKKGILFMVALLGLSVYPQAQWIDQATGFTTSGRGINFVDIVDPMWYGPWPMMAADQARRSMNSQGQSTVEPYGRPVKYWAETLMA
jgi:hypothetical protein